MASKLFHLIATFSLLSHFFPPSSAQTCSDNALINDGGYRSCTDLPLHNSFLYWNYDPETGKLGIAFRHVGMTTSKWVAWAINQNGLASAMVGAQAVVAFRQSDGKMKVYTSQIAGYVTSLTESNLIYPVSDLSGKFENGELVFFANLEIPVNTTVINQVWQEGPVSGDRPGEHAMDSSNFQSKGTLDLLSGQSATGGRGSSKLRKRNVHGFLNAVSWGILMPMGVMIARYMKVFTEPTWFYLHITCQISAYAIGVAGWATGLRLGTESSLVNTTHRNIGISLFALATLQLVALLVRPNKDHKYRLYWNIYHHSVGYSVIILSIMNILRGFKILKPEDKWKHAYVGSIVSLFIIAVLLEAYTWFLVWKRKKTENFPKLGMMNAAANGA